MPADFEIVHRAPKEHIGWDVPKLSPVLLFGLIFSVASWSNAQSSVRFEFLPPEVDGTYSLGIYDSKGALVRSLAKASGEEAFKIGLNGFIATWDGIQEDGRPAPAGVYRTHGFVVPKITLVPAGGAAPVPVAEPVAPFREAEVVGMTATDAPFVLGVGTDGARKIWIGAPGAPISATIEGLGAGATSAAEIRHPMAEGFCVGCADGLFMIDAKGWKAAQLFESTTPVWVAYQGDTIATIFGAEFGATGLKEEDTYQKEEIPAGLRPMPGPDAKSWYLAGADGSIFKKIQGDPALIPFQYEKFGKLVAAATGAEGSIWLVETGEDGTWELRQFAADGEFLRQLPGGNTTILGLASSTKSDALALLRKEGDESIQLVTLTRKPTTQEAESEVVDFEEWTAMLVAPPAKPSKTVEVRLTKNPLEPGKAPNLAVRAGVDAEGIFVQTEEGLFLKRLLSEQGIKNATLGKTAEGLVLRVFGTGEPRSWVIKGLERAMEFKPGEVEYP